jgi:hypothetical protein
MLDQVVIAKEIAIDEFKRMCLAYRIDLAPSEEAIEAMMRPTLNEETGEELAPGLSREEAAEKLTNAVAESEVLLIAAIMSGRLTVDEQGKPSYAPRTPNAQVIKFKKPTGNTFLAMDAAGDKPMLRSVLAAQELTGSAPGTLSKLEAGDFRVVTRLGQIFLAQG